jgi:hypothetical protein
MLYSHSTDNAENTALPLHSAEQIENTSHVIAKHCLGVTSLRLRGSAFTKPLPGSGLHNPVVPLLRECCYCGSAVLASSKYATIQSHIFASTLFCLLPASCWFLAWVTLQPWKWRWNFAPKRRFVFNGLQGVTFQKIQMLRIYLLNIQMMGTSRHPEEVDLVSPCFQNVCLVTY